MTRRLRNIAITIGLMALGVILIESLVSAGCWLFLALFSPESLSSL